MLSPADVDRIAVLARLELTDEERTRLAAELTGFLSYADQVQQADTSAAAAPAPPAAPRLRDDELGPCLDRDQVLDEAPAADRAAGLFKVPRVLGS